MNSILEYQNGLKNNFFENGTKMYHQEIGTAKGSKYDPQYANLFKAGLEEKLFLNKELSPHLWLRYLDDILCVWTQGLDKLREFFDHLITYQPTIKFTMENSSNKIYFLDVTVIKVPSITKIHKYLHSKSCHRNIYKKSIPY